MANEINVKEPFSTYWQYPISSHHLLPSCIGIGMDLRLLDVRAEFLLPFPVRTESRISLAYDFLELWHLLAVGKGRHQLGLAQWNLMALVHLPQVVYLAVQLDDILHLRSLGFLPCSLRHQSRRLRHDEHARLDFKNVAVPQLALVRIERLIQLWCNHVLDANEASAWVRTVIEDTLTDILGQMATVMICLHNAFWIVSVDVEGVQMCANRFDWSEVLGQTSTSLEDLALSSAFVACYLR